MSYKTLFSQLPKDLTDIIVDYHNDIYSTKRHKIKFNKTLKKISNIEYKKLYNINGKCFYCICNFNYS